MDAREKHYGREYSKKYFVDGTAARKLQVLPDYEREQEQISRPQVVERPVKAPKLTHGIDFVSMVLLVAAMAITLYLCYNYLQVQGNIVQLERDIAVLSGNVDTITAENAALEDGLNRTIDWEKVYSTAIGELGMVYPNGNEVITYKSTENGYVIQYKDIPE
ncbi:MAG: hypothetical protein J1E35_00955 [Lachnospiraceae bacterium]|nr:hypothetical protein [Lachnospiraceae bacterium]